MKYKILLLILFFSCSSKKEGNIYENKYLEYEFAVLNNEPIFEDEYLFNKESKKVKIEKVDEYEIYHIDWNNNNEFGEIGVDYLGLKSKLANKPIITKLKSDTYLRINGISYKYTIKEIDKKLVKSANIDSIDLNTITKLTPIELVNGDTLYPETKKDSTVIYFWATWCRPCIETLKNIDGDKLENSGIEFIPIAYNCSGTKEFLNKNELLFEDLTISELSAEQYNIKSLSKQYTFLKDKSVSNKNVNLKKYYH